MADRTHYQVIDAEPQAPKADLKAAYVTALESAQAAGDTQETTAVRKAWQVLSDPVQRARYDEEIGLHHRGGLESGHLAESNLVAEGEAGAGDVEIGPEMGVEIHDDDDAGALGPPPFHQVPDFLEQPTLGRRVTASLIDVITTLAVFLVSITITYQITGADSGLAGVLTFMGWAEAWIVALYLIPTYRTGQTLGKRMTYVMTVDRETGALVSVSQVIRRYMVPMVAIPALFQMGAFLALFFGLSYAMGRDQLSLADRLAKTVVVVARYKPTRSGRSA